MNRRKLYFLTLLLCFLFSKSDAQIALSNLEVIDKMKSGKTYVAMKDPSAEKSQPFIDIFKKYWTLSEIEFIAYRDVESKLSPESYFFTVGGYETNTQFVNLYRGSRRNGINYSNTHLYLELWGCSEKYFEKAKKKAKKKKKLVFDNDDKIKIARIEIFTDFETLSDPDLIFQNDYDGDGHFRNWGPGFLKNYLQYLSTCIEKGKSFTLYKSHSEPKELKRLKRQKLYVPDYTLIKFNKFSGDESKRHEASDIFKKSKLKYEIISTEELDNKILADEEEFYYLVYVKSSTDKFVTVVNSRTGEFLYTTYSPVSYNIKSKDIKKLEGKIF